MTNLFLGIASSSLAPDALSINVTAEQLAPSTCHGVHVNVEQVSDFPIATVTEFVRLKARIEPSLAFIQEAVE